MTTSLVKLLEVPHPEGEPRATALISFDTKPIEKERRVWRSANYSSIWAVVAFNMSNFQLGSGLLALGLNWWQTIVVTLFGHIFAAFLVVACSYPGLEYHISFPIVARIGWGFIGSIFVVTNRILLSIVWTGIQSWLGGLVTYVCLRAIWPQIDHIHNTIPASTGMNLPQFIGFIVFFVIQFPLLFLSPNNLRWLLAIGATSGFIVQLVLVSWAGATMGELGFGSVLSSQVQLSGSKLAWMVLYGISVTISSVTSGTLSICDYTRFARSPYCGVWSQLAGWLPAWLSNIFGVLTIAATQNRYGTQLWNAAGLLIAIQDKSPTSATRAAVFFAGLCMGLSQLALNIVGNTFSGGTDMSSLLPRWINIRRGQILTALLSVAINPWYLLSSATIFLSTMSGYTVFLQPFLAIMVAQYFIIQKRRLRVADLYMVGGQSLYWYGIGVNWRAVVAWVVGMAPLVPGFVSSVNPAIKVSDGAHDLYYINPWLGFLFAFIVMIGLDFVAPVQSQKEFVSSISVSEAIKLYEDGSGASSSSVEVVDEETKREP